MCLVVLVSLTVINFNMISQQNFVTKKQKNQKNRRPRKICSKSITEVTIMRQ